MKIYKLSQNINNDYDTYDSVVVCAENEEEAKKIHPSGKENRWKETLYAEWAEKNPEAIVVEEIGIANSDQKKGVIIASFNAG